MDAHEIGQMEALCIQDEPAYCTASCPVHVDVRLLLNNVQKGNYVKALKIYEKQVLFPEIISRICDEPCKAACVRTKIDDAVAIRRLEKACVDFAPAGNEAGFAVPKKDKRIAVVGGGLSGLSCALELANKGYGVTVFEKAAKLGGRLWGLDPNVLPPAVIDAGLSRVQAAGVEIRLSEEISRLSELAFDAVYVATGTRGNPFEMAKDRAGKVICDPVSLVSAREGVFAGGSLLADGGGYSPVVSVAHGVRAARSINRFLKNASLTGSREKELFSSTRLYTELRGRESKAMVEASDPVGDYRDAEAREEAARCLQCECKECVKACVFLQFYSEYPKQYVKHISKSLNVVRNLGTRFAARLLNSCSLCGLCREICVTDLDMGQACLEARRLMVAAGDMPPAFHDFFLREMAFANSEQAFFVRNQPGTAASSYLFFPGCQLTASSPALIGKTYGYLVDRLTGGVGLMTGCCGAPAAWAGQVALHAAGLQTFRRHWEALARPQLIVACPTCKKIFNDHLPEVPVETLWTIMADGGLPAGACHGNGRPLAIYDPCSSRYDPRTQGSIRTILRRLGWQINELPLAGKYAQCCSYGGLIAAVNPELASQISRARVAASPHPYVTYCSNCRDDFVTNGKPTWHLLDLLFANTSEAAATRKPPSHSDRRENQRRLKAHLLTTLWGEETDMDEQEYDKISLIMADKVKEKMDSELILTEEVKQVILSVEQAGNKVVDGATGNFVAHGQLGIITYWVEYTPRGDAYEVFNVYSHRMQIVEKGHDHAGRAK